MPLRMPAFPLLHPLLSLLGGHPFCPSLYPHTVGLTFLNRKIKDLDNFLLISLKCPYTSFFTVLFFPLHLFLPSILFLAFYGPFFFSLISSFYPHLNSIFVKIRLFCLRQDLLLSQRKPFTDLNKFTSFP